MYNQGCKSVSSIGGGDDQHILVTFLIWGDDFKISFLMTFFFVRQAFFSPFFVKIQLLGGGGDVSPIPPGFVALCTMHVLQ